MQDRVRGINNTIQASENNGNHNKTRLASIVTQVDLDRCVNFIEKVRQERFNKVMARQVRKFDILGNKNKPKQDSNHSFNNNRPTPGGNVARLDNNNQLVGERDISKWVINLSKTELTSAQKAVLVKGPTLPYPLITFLTLNILQLLNQCVPNLRKKMPQNSELT